jgi:hypothetical protein
MKDKIDRMLTANPYALIVAGMMMTGCSMVAFASLRWPDAFYGILGTFLP